MTWRFPHLIWLAAALLLGLGGCNPDGSPFGGASLSGTPKAAGTLPPPLTKNQPPVSPAAPGPLDPLFASLNALEKGQGGQVSILQLGDSHTAGDSFSGHLRDLFQRRFGNGGRGMLPAGVPFDSYRPKQVSVSAHGWTTINSFSAPADGPFGLTGFRTHASRPDSVMTIAPKDGIGFDRVEIGLLLRPEGGSLVVSADGVELSRASTAGTTGFRLLSLPLAAPASRISLAPAGDGPVELLSWTVLRNSHGVVLDSQGIIGTTITILDRWDRAVLAQELAARAPALILLAFGTNEGFDDSLSATAYTAKVTRVLSLLHELAPGAALLVIGPPDAERLPGRCPGASSASVHYSCQPLSGAEIQDYRQLSQGRRPAKALCRWHEPPNLAVVRQVQSRVAAGNGAAFWDWSAVMGNACGLHEWVHSDPPLAVGDHVHMTSDGYARSADALFTRLMGEYQTWRETQPTETSSR